jgi:hypothetical protein
MDINDVNILGHINAPGVASSQPETKLHAGCVGTPDQDHIADQFFCK